METIEITKQEAKDLYWLLRHVQVCFHYYADMSENKEMYLNYEADTVPFIEKFKQFISPLYLFELCRDSALE
ncbi:MAG: hypothetical protein FWD66_10100 [Paludibacter sp.]|nr:hypothetical protein [Paludibacter sp.]